MSTMICMVAYSPSFGYYHKASKTFLIVKVEQTLTDKALKQKQSSISSPPPPPQQRLLEGSQEKGASSWVSALPIDEQGFFMHKGAFRDAIR